MYLAKIDNLKRDYSFYIETSDPDDLVDVLTMFKANFLSVVAIASNITDLEINQIKDEMGIKHD